MSDVHATPIAWQYVCYSLPILIPMSVYVLKKCFANKYRILNSKVNSILNFKWSLINKNINEKYLYDLYMT